MNDRILIIDDEPFILSQMSAALYNVCDFRGEVKTVENGKDAIKEIGHYFYNICFLDINLPDINGLDVMKKINEKSPETKIVIMTASLVTTDMKKTIEKEASLFIEKPFDIYQIKAFVKRVLGGGGVLYKEDDFCRRGFVL